MDSQTAGSDATAGIPGAGNEMFLVGQSVEAASGLGNSDGTAVPYHHQFDPNCEECRRQAYVRLQEEILARPQQWEPVDPTRQFYDLPRRNMLEDEIFPSLSDFEDVTYFNQPYLAHYQEQQQQQHQLFPTLLALAEEQQPAFGLQSVPDEAIEPLLFQQVASAEAFEPTTFQSTALESTTVEQLTYVPATIEPTMFEQPTILEPTFAPTAVEASTFEPLEFNFNTLPHGPVQQRILDEPWATTHDGGLFESTSDDYFKREASIEGRNLTASTVPQVAESAPSLQNLQSPIHFEPLASNRVSVRAPRRLLPSNGHRQRSVHRQPEARSRRLPVLHSSSEAGSERAAKDHFLVQSRIDGLSYKDIKQLGNFKEAESTLRGRHRTLTKDKKDRVRDPKWTEIDDHLLKEAVRVLGHGLHPARAKLSWMAVSKYISNHGGSYGFGYSTCHRRWAQLEAAGQLGDNDYDNSWVDDDDEAETLAEAEDDGESEHEENQDSDMIDEEYQESDEDIQEDGSMAEKDEADESQSESSSDSDDDDKGVSIKKKIKTEYFSQRS